MFSWPTVALKLDSKYVAYIVETFSLISDTIKQTKVTINDTEHIKLKKMFMLRRYTTFKMKLEHSMSVKNIAPRPHLGQHHKTARNVIHKSRGKKVSAIPDVTSEPSAESFQ